MMGRETIGRSITSINFAHFENAYGFPIYVASLQSIQYGALVFDGSTTTGNGLSFTSINTSNVLAVDYRSPSHGFHPSWATSSYVQQPFALTTQAPVFCPP